MSLFVERQDGGAGVSGGRLIAQKSVQMSPGVLQVSAWVGGVGWEGWVGRVFYRSLPLCE